MRAMHKAVVSRIGKTPQRACWLTIVPMPAPSVGVAISFHGSLAHLPVGRISTSPARAPNSGNRMKKR